MHVHVHVPARLAFVAASFALTLSAALADATPQASPSASDQNAAAIGKVAAYAGTWKTHLEFVTTKYSKARIDDSTLHNDCWRSGGYFSCNQIVNGTSVVLLTFTYDTAKSIYHSYQIPPDGSGPHEGTLQIDGNTWTYPWTDKDGDTTIYFRVVNVFTGPDTIQFRQEYSTDQQHWTVTGTGVEHRIAPAT